MKRLRVASSCLLFIACDFSFDELRTFRCAIDGTCPSGFVCDGEDCVRPSLNGPCRDDSDCHGLGADVQCDARKVCRVPQPGDACESSADCSSDGGTLCVARVCTRPAIGSACARDGDCPGLGSGVKCIEKQCARPACESVVTTGSCLRCSLAFFTVSCGGGMACPENGVCGGGGMCSCSPGFDAVSCSGTQCMGANCSAGQWWCRPQNPVDSCTSAPTVTEASCRCYDGRRFTMPCHASESCHYLCSEGCDTVVQSCIEGADKCTVTTDPNFNGHTTCLPLTGTVGAGGACQRQALGRDDCGRGLICTRISAPAGGFVCRAFCRRHSQCANSERCLSLLTGLIPDEGACVASGCGLYDTSCGAGRSCAHSPGVEQGSQTYCKVDGSGAAGTSCVGDSDCARNLVCSSGRCWATCNQAHPCSAGQRCAAAGGLPQDGGTCVSP